MRILLFIHILLLLSCNSKGQKVARSCVAFNNAAMAAVDDYNKSPIKDPSVLHRASAALDQAIECDSTYAIAYHNKVMVLNALHSYTAGLKLILKLERFYPLEPSLYLAKGIQYEKLANADSARLAYMAGLSICERRLSENGEENSLVYQKIYLLAMLEGRDSALVKLDEYIMKNPRDEELKSYREAISNFDKSALLSE